MDDLLQMGYGQKQGNGALGTWRLGIFDCAGDGWWTIGGLVLLQMGEWDAMVMMRMQCGTGMIALTAGREEGISMFCNIVCSAPDCQRTAASPRAFSALCVSGSPFITDKPRS